jgi:hypothetical protein
MDTGQARVPGMLETGSKGVGDAEARKTSIGQERAKERDDCREKEN